MKRIKIILLIIFYGVPVFCTSISPYIISPNGIGSIHIGSSYSEVESYCKQNGFRIEKVIIPNMEKTLGMWIYSRDELLLYIGNKNNETPPLIVRHIAIFSNRYIAKNGICVGMSLSELFELYPSIKILESAEPYTPRIWVFYPKELGDQNLVVPKGTVFVLEMKTEKEIDLAIHSIDSLDEGITGKVVNIQIYSL
jgi:hypothetical protein